MAALNMPTPSQIGETYLAPNGVNYVWDGVKWTVAEDAASGVNLWARNSVAQEIQPIYPGDDVLVADGTNTVNARINADGSIVGTSVAADHFDIDSLDALP